MCIPLQMKDLPVTAIFLCAKCLDIVSQIEGWIDLMRQRIFDAHEGAILYPETPLWLQALSGPAASRTKEVEAVPPVAEEVVLGPPAATIASTAASPPQDDVQITAIESGVKRKQSLSITGVPPKKIAAAVAAATAASPSPPCTSAAVRSAIDSLTTIMNVVQSQASPKKSPMGVEEPPVLPEVPPINVKHPSLEEPFVVKPDPEEKSKETVKREMLEV